jgi:DNA-binding IclR family transcriptional regulator
MSSTPLFHPDDDETRPLSEDQGIARAQERESDDRSDAVASRSSRDPDSTTTDLDELNDEGVGGTLGAQDRGARAAAAAARDAGRGHPPPV